MSLNSFKTRSTLSAAGRDYQFFDLKRLAPNFDVSRLPYSLKILLENLLRKEDGISVTQKDIEALLTWSPSKKQQDEIAFTPARVILQDFTGVPAMVDLAAMRDAMDKMGGKVSQINPLSPVELVIDHSVMVDYFGNHTAFEKNVRMEFARNEERYALLRWGQMAFDNFRVVPPGTGIVHQVNLEYLVRVVFTEEKNGEWFAYPDTLVGTDSHTTMINALGVLGWGVGGIEAEAAMLGQAVTMLIPEVLGFKIIGQLKEGTTATDLVLTVTEILRHKHVVGKFVEFYGDGLDNLPLADRATIANMSPESGATCSIFPIDKETLQFMRLCGRDADLIELIEKYSIAQGFFRTTGAPDPQYNETITLDLGTVEPCIAGPRRPQDRIPLKETKANFKQLLNDLPNPSIESKVLNHPFSLSHGHIVIAAISSCTNTSNPDVMIAAGLVAKKALEKGLMTKPWVKTSLAPGSKVVTDYLDAANLSSALDTLGFNLVAYGCTTCIGNSGPLDENISEAIKNDNIAVAAVISSNRNFEGRIHPEVRYAYLLSPPLVIVYALAGTMNIDLYHDPIGHNDQGEAIYLKDIWPSRAEIQQVVQASVKAQLFTKRYAEVFTGDKQWQSLSMLDGDQFKWNDASTYVKLPPFFDDIQLQPSTIENIENARVLVSLSDSVTTDHISPAGNIAKNSPAGLYLQSKGIDPKDFNSYGSRRGNHEVMMRGTFANIRLKNQLLPQSEGNWTLYLPTQDTLSIFDAAMRYQEDNTPLLILAGKEYGTGSSRDWAAKGTRLLGVKAVIAESFERIHRSNLIGMGVLPLEYLEAQNAHSLQLTGREFFSLNLDSLKPGSMIPVEVISEDRKETRQFQTRLRIDTPKEMEYYLHGGILQYVLRDLAKKAG